MSESQKSMILKFMQKGYRINKLAAFHLMGCMTLAQRIDDIEAEIEAGIITGWRLMREADKEHNNAMVYWMERIGEEEVVEVKG